MLQSDGDHIQVHNRGILELTNFVEELEGMYSCIATTDANYVKHSFRLNLMEPCNLGLCLYLFLQFPLKLSLQNVDPVFGFLYDFILMQII